MNTKENNRLIAEFMGMTYGDLNDDSVMIQMTPKGNEVVPIELMEYHTSWDWLMPVVVRCLNEENTYSGGDEKRDIHYMLNDAVMTINIDAVYKAVVEFIKQYNNQ